MKKRALPFLLVLALIAGLFLGLGITASAATTYAGGTQAAGTIVVDVIVQNNSNYASPAWNGFLFDGSNATIAVSEDATLENGDIYSFDYDTGTAGVVVSEGSSAQVALEAVLDAASIAYGYDTYSMLDTINGLAADYGDGFNYWSFWHMVDGTYYYANLGLSSYVVSDGETICLAYQSNDGAHGLDPVAYSGTSTSSTGFYFDVAGTFAYDSDASLYALTMLPDATSFSVAATPNSGTKTVSVYSAANGTWGPYMGSYLGGLGTAIPFNDGDMFCIVEGSEEYAYYFTAGKADSADALAFYSSGGWEYSMLGNNWTASYPLTCAAGEAAANLRNGYDGASSSAFRYLSACTNVTVSNMSDLNITVYYSSTYDENGAGYTEVTIPAGNTSGSIVGATGSNLSYQNAYVNGAWGTYYNFMIYPDTTTVGTYYYYVVIQDSGDPITSIDSQAVVEVGNLYAWGSVSGDVMTASYITSDTGSLDVGDYYLKFQAKDFSDTPLYFFTAEYARDDIPASGSVEVSGAGNLEVSLIKASDGTVVDSVTASGAVG